MTNQLSRILEHKKLEVAGIKREHSLQSIRALAEAQSQPRDFYAALNARVKAKQNAIIAEIKQASPSRGLLTSNFNPAQIARDYQAGGAACLSVLTDRTFFRGDNHDLTVARNNCTLPVLRKDFVIEPYQIYQARSIQADAVLLIAAALDDSQLTDYHQLAGKLQMTTLVEVHNLNELERVLQFKPRLIGINNRDLTSFVTDLATSEELAPRAQSYGGLAIAESGLAKPQDLLRLNNCGVYGFLIGESLITNSDRKAAVQQLL